MEFSTQTNPYASFIGGVEQPTLMPEQQGYAAVQQPIPPEVQALQQPTNNPVEIEQRKEGWTEIIKRVSADPNFMRALGMFGAAAMQPMQRGETTAGRLGSAYVVGQSAYDFGKQAEFERQRAMTEEQRKAEESKSLIAQRGAQTEGMTLDNRLKRETMQTSIDKARLEYEKAVEALAKEKDERKRAQIALQYEERIAKIKQDIPDAQFRVAFEAELTAKKLAPDLINAQIGQARAAAASSGAAAGRSAVETSILNEKLTAIKDLKPEDRRAFVLGIGKYGTGAQNSAQVRLLEMYEERWQKANPKRPNETDDAYSIRQAQDALRYMTEAKGRPDSEDFLKWAALYGTGDYTKDKAAYEASKGAVPAGNTPAGGVAGRGEQRTRVIRDANGQLIVQPAAR